MVFTVAGHRGVVLRRRVPGGSRPPGGGAEPRTLPGDGGTQTAANMYSSPRISVAEPMTGSRWMDPRDKSERTQILGGNLQRSARAFLGQARGWRLHKCPPPEQHFAPKNRQRNVHRRQNTKLIGCAKPADDEQKIMQSGGFLYHGYNTRNVRRCCLSITLVLSGRQITTTCASTWGNSPNGLHQDFNAPARGSRGHRPCRPDPRRIDFSQNCPQRRNDFLLFCRVGWLPCFAWGQGPPGHPSLDPSEGTTDLQST